MRDGPLVQMMATAVVMWLSISVMPASGESLLSLVLPKDTFIIPTQNFNTRSSRPVSQRQLTVPHSQVSGGRVPAAPQPTRPQPPIVTSRQRVRVPTKTTVQSFNVQHQSTSSQNQFPIPQPNNGGTRHPSCGVMPNPGDCRAAFPRYFYNSQTDQCDCFLYGGCGNSGLQYSYRTLEECQQTCVPSNLEEGPLCKEVFGDDDEVFYDSVTNPPRPSHHLPKPDTSHLSDESFLYILMNSITPENLVDYDDDDERNIIAGNRRV